MLSPQQSINMCLFHQVKERALTNMQAEKMEYTADPDADKVRMFVCSQLFFFFVFVLFLFFCYNSQSQIGNDVSAHLIRHWNSHLCMIPLSRYAQPKEICRHACIEVDKNNSLDEQFLIILLPKRCENFTLPLSNLLI